MKAQPAQPTRLAATLLLPDPSRSARLQHLLRFLPFALLLLATAAALLAAAPAGALPVCSATAQAAYTACLHEISDDLWIATGNCLNEPAAADAFECRREARQEWAEARGECGEQRAARRELCDALGEAPYDPDFDPADFEDDFTGLNPYFPLAVGNQWTYEGGDETTVVEVQDATKLIEGVTCIVVRDVVSEDGVPLEDTDDWYAQASNGDVWYTGEISQSFELFDGDDPEVPELVELEGSWKTGRDGAKPGIVMFANPLPGTVYRQEISLGDAEDAAEVLVDDYDYGDDAELDLYVPAALATLLCDGDCVVTREFTPLEPDVEERKYYAPGVGLFLEVDVTTGDTTELVACNVDPICGSLP
jgi:hypothetical protein